MSVIRTRVSKVNLETMFDCPLSKTVKILDQRSCRTKPNSRNAAALARILNMRGTLSFNHFTVCLVESIQWDNFDDAISIY